MDATIKQLSPQNNPEPEAKKYKKPTRKQAEAAVTTLLLWAGENPAREGLIDTPKRVVNAYAELFSGYNLDAKQTLKTVFEHIEGYGDIVLVRDIPFFSHCEHHMAPFYGMAHVAYYPTKGVVGLSKLARVVDIFARRLQTQETMTAQIADTIDETLNPRGVAVLIEAEHMCMSMRGVQKQGAKTLTTQFTGIFKEDPAEQMRFMTMLRM